MALVAAGYLWHGIPLALLLVALCLGYFGQCYATAEFKPRRPRLLRRRVNGLPVGPPESTFHCARCGGVTPGGITHVCPVKA